MSEKTKQAGSSVELPLDEAVEVFKKAEGCEVTPLTEKDQANIKAFFEKGAVLNNKACL
jgi:hypothetical protein